MMTNQKKDDEERNDKMVRRVGGKKRVLLYKKENQFIIEYFEYFDIRNHKIDQIGISSSFIYCKINWNS
jgi:hypothetical protein